MAVVGIEKSHYQITEGDVAVVCVVVSSPNISCPVTFYFELNISVGLGMIVKLNNTDLRINLCVK